MTVTAAWMAQQLAEFTEVFDGDDDVRRLTFALDQVAESFDAELAMVVLDGEVRRTVGLPDTDLRSRIEAAPLGTSVVHGDLGDIHVAAVAVPRGARDDRLVVGRLGEPLSAVELTLVRSMARTLGVALELHEARAIERCLHEEIEERSRSNARLLDNLSHRQRVLDHLFQIQKSISERAPIMQVLDSITAAAAELIPNTFVGLRLVEAGGDTAVLAAVVGGDGILQRTDERIPIGEGIAGRSILENRFLVADDYRSCDDRTDNWVALGVTTVMATPVRRNGAAVGSLIAMTWEEGRRFGEEEQHLLQSLAEHGSLAFNDASALSVIQQSLERAVYDSQHDQLTGLANRKQAVDCLADWAGGDVGTSVIFVDLDRFKAVNDAYGHTTGDEILRIVAARLTDAVRVDDIVARLSGDEFLVIARSSDEALVEELAARVADTLNFVATVGFRDVRVSASVGCARHLPGETPDDVVANADLAMYRAKESGGGRLVRFDGAMRDERTAELTLERELRAAIDGDQLDVFFQPVVDLADGALIGAEALVRWRHPERGVLAPGLFVDAAEASGLIGGVDEAALRRALEYLGDWEERGMVPERFRLSVNVSARRFGDACLAETVAAHLARRGIEPSRLWLEITETVMMRQVDESLRTMHALRDLGVHLAVDDFGTGWSSLSYLKQFPVEALKVDQSFVAGVCGSDDDRAIVEATVQLASALGLGVVAEGVEEPEQADALRSLGCRAAQGYLFSRPVPADEFVERWLLRPLVRQ